MSWKPEVQTAGEDEWSGNALRFANKEDAEEWVLNLSYRWTAVTNTRVVESEDEPNR
jgi:hypothetical protein